MSDAAVHTSRPAGNGTGLSVPVTAQALLSTPPPQVSDRLAQTVAQEVFGFSDPLVRLSGEQDCNFLVAGKPGQRRVLKFINPLESAIETDFQIAVLRHLAKAPGLCLSAQHVAALDGADVVETLDDSGRSCRVRAYSYLEGVPATQAAITPEHGRALGAALAHFDRAMMDFEHPGVHREILWNLMQLGQLAPLVAHIEDAQLREKAAHFIAVFDGQIAPRLRGLRHQVIHNDLSQSNYVLGAEGGEKIAGILDFGDMAYAPLVCDLAIAISYQMGTATEPFAVLDDVVSGFDVVLPLLPEEREWLLDVVLARVVQRLVITEWRAASFPDNRAYILRHTPQARRLLMLLEPVWRERARHGHAKWA